ncbi:MAG: acylphosphatase [Gemmatimonadaceae bacterium]
MPAARFEVIGRVQGVGFRWFVRERARALSLAGWVRNNSSGEVELMASGTAAALDELEAALQRGPSGAGAGARVQRVVREAVAEAVGEGPALPFPFSIVR